MVHHRLQFTPTHFLESGSDSDFIAIQHGRERGVVQPLFGGALGQSILAALEQGHPELLIIVADTIDDSIMAVWMRMNGGGPALAGRMRAGTHACRCTELMKSGSMESNQRKIARQRHFGEHPVDQILFTQIGGSGRTQKGLGERPCGGSGEVTDAKPRIGVVEAIACVPTAEMKRAVILSMTPVEEGAFLEPVNGQSALREARRRQILRRHPVPPPCWPRP